MNEGALFDAVDLFGALDRLDFIDLIRHIDKRSTWEMLPDISGKAGRHRSFVDERSTDIPVTLRLCPGHKE